jgi:hypothetical protein
MVCFSAMTKVLRSRERLTRLGATSRWLLASWAVLTIVLFLTHIGGVLRPSPKDPSPFSIPDSPDTQLREYAKFSAKEVITAKLAIYHEQAQALHLNMYWQVGLAVLCILIVGKYSRDLDVPFLGVKVPGTMLAFLLPAVLCYLWLEFGYKLNGLIELRLAISSLLMRNGDVILRNNSDSISVSALSQHPFLSDSGILDGWFLTYWPDYSIHRHSPTSQALFGLTFGLLFGLVHASILAALVTACHIPTRPRWLGGLVLCIAFCVLVLSHWQFAWAARNPNWIQPLVWLFALVFLFYLLEYGEARRHEEQHEHRDESQLIADLDAKIAQLQRRRHRRR